MVVNGAETRSTGADRRYVSNGLQPGRNYTYKVDATFYRGGKPVTETKTVQLTAGATANLVFGDSQSQKESTVSDSKNNDTVAQAPVETKLTVTVPADAKVFLSGSPTRMTGDTRTYTTTKLARGQDWPNYVVRVEVDQDGQKLSQERTITLTAGANQQLTFQFDADKVASATR